MTLHDLNQLHELSLTSCSPDNLTDITNLQIDRGQPVPQRIESFIRTVGNPYLFRVGAVVVKVNFNPDGKSFQNAMADALRFHQMDELSSRNGAEYP